MDITGNKSSRERTLLGANTLEIESSREREGQGVKGLGSEWARVLPLVDSLLGANWPVSEKAVNSSDPRHFSTSAELSGHIGISAKVSYAIASNTGPSHG